MGNYTEITTIILRLVVSFLIAFVIPALKAWLDRKLENEKMDQIRQWAYTAVNAAERAYKDYKTKDPDGVKRKHYAKIALLTISSKLKVELTDKEIDALIEAAVEEINAFRH